MRHLLLTAVFLFSISALAEPMPTESSYVKPEFWDILRKTPDSLNYTVDNAFTWDRSLEWTAVAAASFVTYYYDEEMLLEAQRWGREAGIGNEEHTKTYIELGEIDVFRGPSDTGSLMYYIGDGWFHFGIVGGLLLYGETKESNRAVATSYQMIHGMMISTLFNQIGKRSTGRESPNERTEKRGKWRPFPSIAAYGENTPKYDAVPSGHVMTTTMNLTILLNNYPEKRWWILPTGCTLITLLSFQMMNNGVHWASDYPLGIAMGVFFGNMVKPYWRTDLGEEKEKENEKSTSAFLPFSDGDAMGVQWVRTW